MSKTLSLFALLLTSVVVAPLAAQETVEVEQQGGIVNQVRQEGEGGDIQVFSMTTDGTGNVGMGNMVLASPLSMGGFSDPTQMMFNPQVRKELDLADEQVAKLKEISKKFSQQLKEQMKFDPAGGRSKLDMDRIKNIGKIIQNINAERESAIGAVLLPHQSKRLKEISTQMRMRNNGAASALVSKDIAEELEIDDEQKKRIKTRAAEIKKKLEADIAKLKEEAQEELMKELNRKQRDKLQEMTGDKFEYKKVNWRDRVRKMREQRRSEKKSDR